MSSKNTEKIKELEEELKKTKYNKRTQHHIGLVKAKIAQLKQKEETRKSAGKKSEGYSVKKSGDATVIMVGFPSVGKSTLLNALTNAQSKTAAYAFTTLTVIPGLLEYKQAKIQLLDVPGIVSGAADGSGRGREVLSVIWSADLVLIILDINELHHYDVIKKELSDARIRVDQKKPDVRIRKKSKNGIQIASTVRLNIQKETIRAILNQFKIMNAEILIRTPIDEDQLIDVIEGNKKYVPSLIAVNKIDTVSDELLADIKSRFPNAVFISAEKKINLEKLRESIFNQLDFIRIYLKQPGKKPDLDEPMVLFKGNTLTELCLKIHKDFAAKFKFARIWGTSVKYDGQMKTKLEHVLDDKDIVELHMR
ncbi:GTP-binding protein [Candidatus Woesearchaeota archaeon]|nr:GTP-binding protein [Candidatus Woesearchaeota archaeon]